MLNPSSKTVTAHDHQGHRHYLYQTSKNEKSSLCLHIDSDSFSNVTFHDHAEVLPPLREEATVATKPAEIAPSSLHDGNIDTATAKAFIRANLSQGFQIQPLWKPKKVTEFEEHVFYFIDRFFSAIWYYFNAWLFKKVPPQLFWPVRIYFISMFCFFPVDEHILAPRTRFRIAGTLSYPWRMWFKALWFACLLGFAWFYHCVNLDLLMGMPNRRLRFGMRVVMMF